MQHRRSKAAIVLIVLAAVAYVANLAIDNPYTHSLVNYYLNEKFLSQLPVRAEYQSMRVQLLPPEIQLFGVKISNKMADKVSNEILSTSQLTFKVGIWSLFLAKPQIGDLELHDLNATWPPPPELLTALQALEPKAPSHQVEAKASWPPKQDPPLASLTIHNAALRIKLDGLSINIDQDPKEITWITTEGTELKVDFRGWREIQLDASIQRLNVADRATSYIEDASFNFSGRLAGTKFTSDQIQIESQRISAHGNMNAELNTEGSKRLINDIQISGDFDTTGDFSILGSFLDLAGTRGRLSGKVHYELGIPVLEQKPVSITFKGSAASANAALYDFNLYQSEADFTIDKTGIDFTELRIKSLDKLYGKGKGKLGFEKGIDFDFRVKPEGLPLDTLLGVFNVPFDFLNFKLSSDNLVVKGHGDPFKMSVASDAQLSDFSLPTLTYDHSHFPQPPSCLISLNLAISSKEIIFDKSDGYCQTAKTEGSRFPLLISGNTTFNEKTGMDLSFRSPSDFNPNVLRYFSQADLSGNGMMTTRVHGPYSNIKVSSQVNIDNFAFGKATLGHFTGIAEIIGKSLSWTDLSLLPQNGGRVTSHAGTLKFDDGLTTSADIQVIHIEHSIVAQLMQEFSPASNGLSFDITNFDGKLSGELLQPLRYSGNAAFDIGLIKDNDQEYATQISGILKNSPTEAQVTQGKYVIGTLAANFDAKLIHQGANDPKFLGGTGLSPADQVEINIAVPQTTTKVDQIQRLPFLNEIAKKAQVTGVVSGTSKLTGNLKKLSGLAKVQVDQVHVMAAPVPSISSSMLIDGLKFDIMAEQGGNSLKGRINMDLGNENMPYNWYLSTKNFDFRPFLPSVFAGDPRNFAYFSGSWSMQGQLKNWWVSTGELEVKRLRAKYHPAQRIAAKPLEITTTAPTKILIKGSAGWSMAEDAKLNLKSEFGSLALGFGTNRPPENMDITTTGRLKIEALKILSNEIETATGFINFSGGISGPFENPKVDILFTDEKTSVVVDEAWESPAIGLAAFRPAFKDIQLRARLINSGVQIESLRANKGSGTVSVDGLFAFPGAKLASTDLNLSMDSATFVYPFPIVKNFDTTLDSNLRITGQNLPLQVAGTINVKRARSNREIDIRQAILESIRSSNTQTGPQTLLPTALFDIRISAAESIGFNSRNAQATLSSNLHLSGSDLVPELSGLIEINRGRFFYKREFTIQRGLINYDDPVKPDPSLDISATSDVGGYRVTIGITGKASAPAIDFAVDPPTRPDGTAISKLDIITLLNRGSLPDTKTGGAASAESTAAAEALNLLTGQVEDTVEKIFDISGQNVIRQVYIDTYAGDNNTLITRFNLPLNITDDLDVILKVDQNTVKLSSEYALHDSISVTGGIESSNETTNSAAQQQSTPADTGVDIKFKFAFP